MKPVELPTQKRLGQTTDDWIKEIVEAINEASRQQNLNTVPDAFTINNFDIAVDELTTLDATGTGIAGVRKLLATLLTFYQRQSPTPSG